MNILKIILCDSLIPEKWIKLVGGQYSFFYVERGKTCIDSCPWFQLHVTLLYEQIQLFDKVHKMPSLTLLVDVHLHAMR